MALSCIAVAVLLAFGPSSVPGDQGRSLPVNSRFDRGPAPGEFVALDGGSGTISDWIVTGRSTDPMGWTSRKWTFVAAVSATTLQLSSPDRADSLFNVLAIDNVQVTENHVPPYSILSTVFNDSVYENGVDVAQLTVVTKSNWGEPSSLGITADLHSNFGDHYSLGSDCFGMTVGDTHTSYLNWPVPEHSVPWAFSLEVVLRDTAAGTTQDSLFVESVFRGDPSTPPSPETYEDLARYWAPVIFQDVLMSDNLGGRFDMLANADFDSNWVGSDSWENADMPGTYPFRSDVYWWVIESSHHWFIGYCLFHPRDWTHLPVMGGENACVVPGRQESESLILCSIHENDMEGAVLTIRKSGSAYGQLRCMATEAHGHIFYFKPPGENVDIPSGHVEDDDSLKTLGGRPCLFVQSGGHGIGPRSYAVNPTAGGFALDDGVEYDFYGEDGILYLPPVGPDSVAQEPSSGDVVWSYQLVSIDSLWRRRGQLGTDSLFDEETYNYTSLSGCDLNSLSRYFSVWGYPYDKCANPPWGWADDFDGDDSWGNWFLDPARATATHLAGGFPDTVMAGYFDYSYNPFLVGNNRIEIFAPSIAESLAVGTQVLIQWTVHEEPAGIGLDSFATLQIKRGYLDWETIGNSVRVFVGAYGWTVTGPESQECRLRLAGNLNCSLVCPVETYLGPLFVFTGPPDVDENVPVPCHLAITNIVPNPFNPETEVRYEVPAAGHATLMIYDVAGRLITILVDGHTSPGSHSATWNGRDAEGTDVTSGAYFARLKAGGETVTRKIMLVR